MPPKSRPLKRDELIDRWKYVAETYKGQNSSETAASDAAEWLFFERQHEVTPVVGVISTAAASPLLFTTDVTGRPAPQQGRVSKDVYELVDGCMWRLVESFPPASKLGLPHHVLPIVLEDGSKVLLDWSLAQFKLAPGETLRLYL